MTKKKTTIFRPEQMTFAGTSDDILKNLPNYVEKTKEEEKRLFKIFRLYDYERVALEERQKKLKDFCEEIPQLKVLLDSDISKETKDKVLKRAIAYADEVRNYFILENTRLVAKIANYYAKCNIPFIDLFQEGVEGLIIATQRFDISKGNKFSTYATSWIRCKVIRYIENHSRMIRLPVSVLHFQKKIKDVETSFFNDFKRMPTDEELADILNTTVKKIKDAKGLLLDATSYDAKVSENVHFPLESIVGDDFNLEEAIIQKFDLERLQELNNILTEKQKYVINYNFGFTVEIKSEKKISAELNISIRQVKRIKKKTLESIRDFIISDFDQKIKTK